MTTQNTEPLDLVVLGSGPGGYVAAIRAAQLGRQVTIIEKEALGGICLNWGCIPSKALLKTAEVYRLIERAAEFGIQTEPPRIDFAKVIERSRSIAAKLSGGVSHLMRKNKIQIVSGYGVLEGDNVLRVTDRSGAAKAYSYKDIIISTGARPKIIPGIEPDGKLVHTSRTILESQALPRKLLVVGAGAIGIEFAYFFRALGADVR